MKIKINTFFTALVLSMVVIFSCSEDDINNVSEKDNNQNIKQEFLPEAPGGKKWKLVWNDEFNGSILDTSKWAHVTWQAPGIDQPRKDGFWRNDAAILDGIGNLKMITYYDSLRNRFIDGAIRTRKKFEKKYGYFEIRVQFQKRTGHWSAFWLFNDDVAKVGNNGTDGTEIDIFEKINPFDNNLYHTLHWDGYGAYHKSANKYVNFKGLNRGFHTVGVWWKKKNYTFYIDGVQTWQTDAGGVCNIPLYIKISDEIGKWAGSISASELPDVWLVDYVRVYDLVEK